MLAKIRRFLRLRSVEENERKVKEAIDQGFHDLPDPRERARMSPEKLAILLSEQQAGTPAYILVEHELDLRIASVQSKATVQSGWLGLIGALLGAGLGFFLGTLSPKAEQSSREQVLRCECVSQVQKPASGSNVQSRSSTVPSTMSAHGKSSGQNENGDGNTKR